MTLLAFTPIAANLSYTGIFIWFLIFNNFIPILEELALMSIGYLSAFGVFNPLLAIFISIVSLSIVDNVVYFLTLSGSKHFKFIEKMMQHNVVRKYQMKMQKNFNKTFILLTFIPKIRFFAPACSGAAKIRWKKFLLLDLSAMSLFVSFYFFLGFFFYQQLTRGFSYLQGLRHLIFAVIIDTLFILSIFAARWIKKKYNI